MKRFGRLTTVLAAISIAAATLAACGNEEQNDYVDQVNNLQNRLLDEITAATSGAAPSNARQAAEIPQQLQVSFDNMADDLEAISAPDEVASLNDELVATLREIADQFADAQKALSSGNAQQAAAGLSDLQSSATQAQTELNSLIDQINAEFEN
jgi:hypothetical protein